MIATPCRRHACTSMTNITNGRQIEQKTPQVDGIEAALAAVAHEKIASVVPEADTCAVPTGDTNQSNVMSNCAVHTPQSPRARNQGQRDDPGDIRVQVQATDTVTAARGGELGLGWVSPACR